jgi:GNAT superfamily N-acetyltransferase
MSTIRPCGDHDVPTLLTIVNSAAEAYRGVIPPDRWHEPYMSLAELQTELSSGVAFSGCEIDGQLVGVMGIQPVRDVSLIRHAYVRPDRQRHGVGAMLIKHLLDQSSRQMLVGTWSAASWAITFYQRNGFVLCSPARTVTLLRTYWTIPDRQIETSVVLANPPITGHDTN